MLMTAEANLSAVICISHKSQRPYFPIRAHCFTVQLHYASVLSRQIWSCRGISPLTESLSQHHTRAVPPVEMRGEEKHLNYVPGVSITLEMKVAKRADSSLQQELQLPLTPSVDSETSPSDGAERSP